jgi:hypothetical protein
MVVPATKTTDIKLGADDFKYYTDLDALGIEFKNPAIFTTTMNFLHLDVWSKLPTDFIEIRDRVLMV